MGRYSETFSAFPIDTGRKLIVHKTFRRRPGRLLSILCTFNLRPVSTGLGMYFLFVYQIGLISSGSCISSLLRVKYSCFAYNSLCKALKRGTVNILI